MNNLLKLLFLAVLVFLFSNSTHANGIEFEHLSLKEGLEKAKKENKKLFIDIYATWCGPCKYLTKNVFVDEDLGEFINENFIALKLDGERDDGLILMEEFNLDSYPTLLFLDTDRALMRKIVGAVSAEDIISGGNAALHPESTKIYQLQKKYDDGDRDRKLMSDLAIEMLNEDLDNEEVVAEFLELFPKADLENEDEFIIFCIGVTDPDDARLVKFIKNIKTHAKNHGDMAATKVIMMMFRKVVLAQETDDFDSVHTSVEELYPAYKTAAEEPAELEELLAYFEEVYAQG